jgi:hypothetical protein
MVDELNHSSTAAAATAAVLEQRASDVSSLDEQRAAVRERKEGVAHERQAVQQIIVAVASIARHD